MKESVFFLLSLFLFHSNANIDIEPPKTPFEAKGANYSATYDETIAFYKDLEGISPFVKIYEYKNGTDAGKPLHLVLITKSENMHPSVIRKEDKRIILINNGIHPGEPCGIDASMILARDLATDKYFEPLLEHLAVLIIPVYNVGGMLNRGAYSRANQNGPEEHGFRGNARNLDLNRDFIKNDSKNARTFAKIFHEWNPDVLIDTHTSNGADYQYIMTYIPTQKDKIDKEIADYMNDILNPELVATVEKAGYLMSTYVQGKEWGLPPDSGLVGFLETPRYSTGYSALFNTIGYTTEAHMFKKFEDRVYGTYHFLLNTLKTVNRDRKIIDRARKAANERVKKQEEFTIRWKLDMNSHQKIKFQGFQASVKPSEVTGFPRLSYDRTKPWTGEIPYYNNYVPEITVKKPAAYLVPQSWTEAIERLELNGVKMHRLKEDATLNADVYYIEEFRASPRPYEGHFPIEVKKLIKKTQECRFLAGDYVIYTDQEVNRYIVECLEPQAHDSYFFWNFFDEVLMQKEHFSPYIFEGTAKTLLETEPGLKKEFEEKLKSDTLFAKNDYAQLDFIYRHSPYYESTHLRYPVVRLESTSKLKTD